ncbi:hypothetical protein [Streptomyces venetus]
MAAATGTLVATAATPSVAATPVATGAQAAPTTASSDCRHWTDNINTYGAGACTGFPSRAKVQASAKCKNGQWAVGNKVAATNWSYAYCAGKGGYVVGTGGYIVFD